MHSPGDSTPCTPVYDGVRFEVLFGSLSSTFANVRADEIDGRIDAALPVVVEFLGVEQVCFAETRGADRAVRITHSCAVPGIPPFWPSALDDKAPWFAGEIRRGAVLRLARVPDDLPAGAARERDYCTRTGVRSQLVIPLPVDGSVRFAIGCATFSRYRHWPEELVRRVRLLGDLFANALTRRRADEALRQRDRRYLELVESTRAVPWVADPGSLQTSYVSAQVVPLLGFPRGAWYREGFWASRLHPDDRTAVLRAIGEAVRRGRRHDLEYRLVAADGQTVWVHDRVTVRSKGGVPQAVRGVMTDITARKRAEGEAARLRDRLARTARATLLAELAAAIAHEVNQPLCAIVSNAETAQGYVAGGGAVLGETRDALQDIAADGRRASDIIRRIRALFRTGQPERAPFSLTAAVREVADLLHHRLTRDGIAVTLDCAADLRPALGDRVQVQQVILNLMLNAAEALAGSPADCRRMTVALAGAGGAAAVSVRDCGPGISPDLLGRVFDAFYTTKRDGTGMGLSVSRTIVEAHGGRIWAEPAAGGGVGGHFTLPLATAARHE